MRGHDFSSQFDVLTINDPFDLADRFEDSNASCLVRNRQMWSITPDGQIYPCCFTVFTDGLSLGNVQDRETRERLREIVASRSNRPACHGLKKSFWRNAAVKTITCPIGSLDPRNMVLRDHAAS